MMKDNGAARAWANSLRDWARRSSVRLSTVGRKPALTWYWVRTARGAQAAALALALLMPTVLPAASDRLLELIYRPVKTEHLFGLLQTTRDNPVLEVRKQQARAVLWAGSAWLVLYLLWRHLPRALGRATAEALRKEGQADALANSRPLESILLYSAAAQITPDAEHEKTLRGKMRSLDEDIGWRAGGAAVPVEAVATDLVAGRYRLDGELGRGAMGIVYRGHDLRLERDVALKRLAEHDDYATAMRLKQEAKALARLNHPNIVQVYDVVQDRGFLWIAMELVEGEELAQRLQREGRPPLVQALEIGAALADALAYAHAREVVHRDFKPANVLLSAASVPKITDFGMAKLGQSTTQTLAGTVLGSPAYMSPEQGAGESADARSDIYSLGVALYELLTGTLPFRGETAAAVIVQHATQPAVAPRELEPSIPVEISDLVLHMLAKAPTERPQSADAIAAFLRGAVLSRK